MRSPNFFDSPRHTSNGTLLTVSRSRPCGPGRSGPAHSRFYPSRRKVVRDPTRNDPAVLRRPGLEMATNERGAFEHVAQPTTRAAAVEDLLAHRVLDPQRDALRARDHHDLHLRTGRVPDRVRQRFL